MGQTSELFALVSQAHRDYANASQDLAKYLGHRFRLTIYGSARVKPNTLEYDEIVRFASKICHDNIDVLTGGGPGVMEAANLGAYWVSTQAENPRRKGRSYGISLRLPRESEPNGHLHRDFGTVDFSSRLNLFGTLGCCHILAHRGGIGTLLEMFTFLQVGQIQQSQGMENTSFSLYPLHPSVQAGYVSDVIVVGDLYDELFDLLERMNTMEMLELKEISFLKRAKNYEEAFALVKRAKRDWRTFLKSNRIAPLN